MKKTDNIITSLNYQEFLILEELLLKTYSFDDDTLAEINLKNITLSELQINSFYIGECRNASFAFWNGNKFYYIRTGWSADDKYIESINHTETEKYECADTFLPFSLLTTIPADLYKYFTDKNLISSNVSVI